MKNQTYDARLLRLLDVGESIIEFLEKEELLPLKYEELGFFGGQHMESIRHLLATIVLDKDGIPLSILTEIGPEMFNVEGNRLVSKVVSGMTYTKEYDLETGKQLKGSITTYDANDEVVEDVSTDSYVLSSDKRFYTTAVNLAAMLTADGNFVPDHTMVIKTKKEVVGDGYCLSSTIQRINKYGEELNTIPYRTEFFDKEHKSIRAIVHHAEDRQQDVVCLMTYDKYGHLETIKSTCEKGESIPDVLVVNELRPDGKLLRATTTIDVPVETTDENDNIVTATEKSVETLWDFTAYYEHLDANK